MLSENQGENLYLEGDLYTDTMIFCHGFNPWTLQIDNFGLCLIFHIFIEYLMKWHPVGLRRTGLWDNTLPLYDTVRGSPLHIADHPWPAKRHPAALLLRWRSQDSR